MGSGTVLCVSIPAAVTAACFFFFWYMPVQFVVISPEIRLNTVFEAAECRLLDVKVEPYRCCRKTSCSCSESFGTPSCSLLLNLLQEGSCGDGYRCCRQCCSTCCTGSGSSRSCRSCNCRCCSSVSNEACQVICGTCHDVTRTYEYTCLETNNTCCSVGKGAYTEFKGFGLNDFGGMAKYRDEKQVNRTESCWYDPDKCSEVSFFKGLTPWKWGIVIAPICVVIVSLMIATLAPCGLCGSSGMIGVGFGTAVWCAFIIPLIIFVPIITVGHEEIVSEDIGNNLTIAAFFFAGIGVSIGYITAFYLIASGVFSLKFDLPLLVVTGLSCFLICFMPVSVFMPIAVVRSSGIWWIVAAIFASIGATIVGGYVVYKNYQSGGSILPSFSSGGTSNRVNTVDMATAGHEVNTGGENNFEVSTTSSSVSDDIGADDSPYA